MENEESIDVVTLPRKGLPTNDGVAKHSEGLSWKGFGKDIRTLKLGINMRNSNRLVQDVLTKMMQLNCQVFGTRS